LIKDIENFFMHLLAISTSFYNYLFHSFAHLFNGLLILCGVIYFELHVYCGY
jgi:hypothetical protein